MLDLRIVEDLIGWLRAGRKQVSEPLSWDEVQYCRGEEGREG